MLNSILIVDDSPFIRRSVRRYIEANTAFYVCGEAENGKVAVEKVRELNPDIVILDLPNACHGRHGSRASDHAYLSPYRHFNVDPA